MINKSDVMTALDAFRESGLSNLIWNDGLRIRRGNYEYIFNADEINYIGNGGEFLTYSLDSLTCGGANWITADSVTLGGRDFQISGRVFELEEDMAVRRKIFELYTSNNLNISLYSSGAGKNLDLLVNCGGWFDNYSEPAIIEREYTFALKWRQETSTLSLTVDDTEIYSLNVPNLTERQTFEHLLIGGSMLHNNANWKGTIADFKIYDGYAEA